MPTRKIDTPNWMTVNFCRDSEHLPPTMQLFEPGVYEHECPSCHKVTTFVVPLGPTL